LRNSARSPKVEASGGAAPVPASGVLAMPIRFSPESQDVLRRAQIEASASSLLWPRAEHLLLALAAEPTAAAALAAMGAEPGRVAQQTRDYLASPRNGAGRAGGPTWGHRVWRWLFPPVPRDVATIQRRAALQVLVSGRSDITPLDLLVALFRGADQRRPAPRALDVGADPYRRVSAIIEHPMTSLRQSGVTTAALLRYVAHGECAVAPAVRPEPAPAALVEVHLLNDDYTSMEFVVAALRDEFGLGALPAAELALQVHREGVGTLGTFRYGEVGLAVRRVEERAARLGFPLKVLVLEVTEG